MRAGACDLAIVDVLDASPDVELEPLTAIRPYALFAAGDPLARARSRCAWRTWPGATT